MTDGKEYSEYAQAVVEGDQAAVERATRQMVPNCYRIITFQVVSAVCEYTAKRERARLISAEHRRVSAEVDGLRRKMNGGASD